MATTLLRFDPFREAATMHNELSRLMNGLFEGNGRQTQAWVPTLDAWETADEIVYAFDLPGVSQDQISVEVDEGMLTVSAERVRTDEVKDEHYHRLERRFGTFARTVGLPKGVSDGAITASYTDGVLKVHVRKPELAKPKRIEIGSNAPKTIEGAVKQ